MMQQFKVSLIRAGQPVEIRRISMGLDVNYHELRQKLYSIFPALQSTGMTLTWKDSEGDFVVIGSDEELNIALDEMQSDDCKKLFVNLVSPAPPPRAGGSTPRAVHEGVVCDGCDKLIVGCRYRCLVCPDYDLCSDCEPLGLHQEHVMLRCPYPITRDFHFMKKVKKLHRKFGQPADGTYSHCHRSSRHFAPRAFRCPMMPENVYELVEDFVTALHSQVSDVTPELIQQVIDSLTNLNLAGVNDQGNAESDPDPAARSGESSKKKDKDERGGKKRGCPFSERRSEARPNQAHPPLADFLSSVMNQVGPNLMSVLNQLGSAAAATGGQPQAASTGEQTGSSPSAPSSEPMVVTPEEASSPPSNAAAAEEATGAAIPPPADTQPSSPSQSPFDLMIDRQLRTMLNMGFNNEGGWLKELLVAKQGDIAKVLDQLLGQRSARVDFD